VSQPELFTIARAASLLRTRALSPVELTESLLRRIADRDAGVNAFITVRAEPALEQGTRRREGDCGRPLARAASNRMLLQSKRILRTNQHTLKARDGARSRRTQ
jgi:Asp-tRNA(Asn)/Glu-tRNA(Gln) amidotransferase A subunit family amidase